MRIKIIFADSLGPAGSLSFVKSLAIVYRERALGIKAIKQNKLN